MVQTYSKKPKASAKSSSKDDSSICIALYQNVLDEISATTAKHKGLTTAGASPKESGSKRIHLSLSPKKVNSPIKELGGNIDKAKNLKDSHTRGKLKRHRRASVHKTALVKGYREFSSNIEASALCSFMRRSLPRLISEFRQTILLKTNLVVTTLRRSNIHEMTIQLHLRGILTLGSL